MRFLRAVSAARFFISGDNEVKYKEEDIKENIEMLFLLSILLFSNKCRFDLGKIICKALKIEDEALIMCVEAECIIKEAKMLENAYVSKRYFDDDEHSAFDNYLLLTKKGEKALSENVSENDSFIEMKNQLELYCKKYYKERRIIFPLKISGCYG